MALLAAVALTGLVAGLVVLGYFSTRMVRVISSLSGFTRVPKFILAFVILGFGTSLPDLFISGFAGSRNEISLIVGSVVGANIVLLSLVLGIITLAKKGFKVREKTVLENFGWLFFVLMIPFFLLADGRLTLVEGIILLVVYLMYVYNVSEQEPFFKGGVQVVLPFEENGFSGYYGLKARGVKKRLLKTLFKAVVFLAVILASAQFVVENAGVLSKLAGIPELFVGVSVVALGLTLPELAVNLSALKAREEEIVWGDLIGSFVTELTLVLGVGALFGSALNGAFNFYEVLLAYAFMALAFLLVFFFAFGKKELSRTQGAALVMLYFIFLSLEIDLVLLNTTS